MKVRDLVKVSFEVSFEIDNELGSTIFHAKHKTLIPDVLLDREVSLFYVTPNKEDTITIVIVDRKYECK